MYINEAIRLVKKYYPSEYDTNEMYIWCNEVSSMLSVEERFVLHEKFLPAAKDGTVLLPEGVDIENVCGIYLDGRRLDKLDHRTYGNGRKGIKAGIDRGFVRVVYSEPYRPIRVVNYRGAVTVNGDDGYFELYCPDILPGDSVTITFLTAGGGAEKTFEGVMVMGSDLTENGFRYDASSPDGSFESAGVIAGDNVLVTRNVTDKTVCDAPFDAMYADYILAKINMYQRDMEAYNQFMTAFNSRLAAYRRWLADRMPSGDGKLHGWW
ncbi:MAG: hypothetical protein ACI4TH_01335 [Candidatus Ornithomonoglobus sp.]